MTDLRTLAQRCIDAPGRETDAEIAAAIHSDIDGLPFEAFAEPDRPGKVTVYYEGNSRKHVYSAPPFTTSIDAAMPLIPSDYALAALKEGQAGYWFASLRPRNWITEWRHGEAQSPAQALCAAALIARSET